MVVAAVGIEQLEEFTILGVLSDFVRALAELWAAFDGSFRLRR
jgi:hypothetical protein